ncbi:MAG: ZIP family metal transporter [Firmicutes bacterium]|nr:ZIP family metal transporter [Bacillota bacterium]
MEPFLIILFISTLGPVLGSLIGILKRPSEKFMYDMLSFAAGVMLAISFLELIPESIGLSNEWICIAGIIIGALVMYLTDRLLPHIHPEFCSQEYGCNLKKTALYLIIGISLHNFPEGMAMAIGAVTEIKTGLAIALAIAIHDIPEGICTAAPFYHVTGRRLQSFLVSASTAIPVIIGFIIANSLYQNISPELVGLIVGATAGLMIYICADELIPLTGAKTANHSTIFYLICGVIFVIFLKKL